MLRRLFLVLPLTLTFLLGAHALRGGDAGVAEAQRVAAPGKKSRAAKAKAKTQAKKKAKKRTRTRRRSVERARARARAVQRSRAKKNPLRRVARAAKRTGKRAARAAKRTGKRAARAAKRTGKRTARASWRMAKRAGRAAKNGAKLHLGKRAPVRRNIDASRQSIKEGKAEEAAQSLTGEVSNRRLGLRERFALWRARFAVKRKSRKLLKTRAWEGELSGVEDAVASLEAFEASGHMGAYARYRANSAKRKRFRQTAMTLAGKGDFDGARKALDRAFELAGERGAVGRLISRFKSRRTARKVFDQAMRASKDYAKKGRPDLVGQISDFAAKITVNAGLKWRARRLNRKAPRLMKKANQNLVSAYLKQARKLYRNGETTQAAYTYLAAKEVPVKRGFRQRRLAKKVRRDLGDHLDGLSLEDLQQGAQGLSPADVGGSELDPDNIGPAVNGGAAAAGGR